MRGKAWGATIAAVAVLATAPAASAACEGGRPSQVLFADSFDAFNPTWGHEEQSFRVADGHLVMEVVPGTNGIAAPGFNWFEAYVCADVVVNSTNPRFVAGGLIFWATDANNYWSFLINGLGEATIEAIESGVSRTVWPWEAYAALNPGSGAVNALKLTIAGDQATVHVNGAPVRFVETSGLPPRWLVGVRAFGGNDGFGTFEFEHFEVAQPN